MFIVSAGDFTEVVCEMNGGVNCHMWSRAIRVGMYTVYLAAAAVSGATPVAPPGKRSLDDDSDFTLQWWQNNLAAGNISYAAIEPLPFDADEAALARRSDDPQLLRRVRLAGVVDAATGHKQDIIANHYEGDNTVLHLPETAQGDLSKRFDGHGFKISYTTRKRSLLTNSHQYEMAAKLADYWADVADSRTFNDFIGFAETGHTANFYYRIIPETRGFGLNYESVDICGGMAGYL